MATSTDLAVSAPNASAHWDQITRLRGLRQRVAAARCWVELEALLDRAHAHFTRGELPGRAVEALAEQARLRAREIPEHVVSESGDDRRPVAFALHPNG